MHRQSIMRAFKMKREEIEKIIDRLVSSQMYDTVQPQERDDLVNEAWLAVLEAMAKKPLEPYQVWGLVRHRLIAYKHRMRAAVSIPLNSWHASQFEGREKKPRKVNYIPLEVKEEILPFKKEDKRDFYILLDKLKDKLDFVDLIVLQTLVEGGTPTDAWRKLQGTSYKNLKRRVFSAKERIKKLWKQVVEGEKWQIR